MNKHELYQMCQHRVDEIMDRIHQLCEDGKSDDATALYSEIKDWIVQKNNIEVISLEYITCD